jgi:hypothetical protein
VSGSLPYGRRVCSSMTLRESLGRSLGESDAERGESSMCLSMAMASYSPCPDGGGVAEPVDRLGLVVWRKVSIVQSHTRRGVAQQFPHRIEGDTCHHQATRKRMAQIVPAELMHLSRAHQGSPGFADIIQGLSLLPWKHKCGLWRLLVPGT